MVTTGEQWSLANIFQSDRRSADGLIVLQGRNILQGHNIFGINVERFMFNVDS